MAAEDNKAIVRRFYEEVLNQGNLAMSDELVAADFVDHQPFPGQGPGLAGLKESLGAFRAAFPDLQYTIEDLIAEGDKVVVRATMRGTNEGSLFGLPASGKQVTVGDIDIVRIAGGKMVEGWGITDRLSMMQQLGVIPQMGQPGS
jgi:steroid delta-isomerase-like uncharacterized protein